MYLSRVIMQSTQVNLLLHIIFLMFLEIPNWLQSTSHFFIRVYIVFFFRFRFISHRIRTRGSDYARIIGIIQHLLLHIDSNFFHFLEYIVYFFFSLMKSTKKYFYSTVTSIMIPNHSMIFFFSHE